MSRRAWVLIAVLVLAGACDRSGEVAFSTRGTTPPVPPTVPTEPAPTVSTEPAPAPTSTVTGGPPATAPNPPRPRRPRPVESPSTTSPPAPPPASVPAPAGCATDTPLVPGWLFTAEALQMTNPKELWVSGWGHPTVRVPGASSDPPALGVTRDGGVTWEPLCWPDAWPPSGAGQAIGFRKSMGFVVGVFQDTADAFVLRTEDGGANWKRITLPAPVYKCSAADVVVVNDDHVWIAGVGGVYHSRDGGRTFSRQAIPNDSPCAFSRIAFVDTDHVWVTGDNRLARTTDGGATWTTVDTPLPLPAWNDIADVAFVDTAHGFIATSETVGGTSRALLFATDDGGSTWHEALESGGIFRSIDFIDGQHGFLAGGATNRGEIYATADGGRTWELRATLSTRDIQVVSFLDLDRGFGTVSNRPCIIATTDGGRTWSKTPVAGASPAACQPD